MLFGAGAVGAGPDGAVGAGPDGAGVGAGGGGVGPGGGGVGAGGGGAGADCAGGGVGSSTAGKLRADTTVAGNTIIEAQSRILFTLNINAPFQESEKL